MINVIFDILLMIWLAICFYVIVVNYLDAIMDGDWCLINGDTHVVCAPLLIFAPWHAIVMIGGYW